MDRFTPYSFHDIPMEVEFYSGSRRDESPRYLNIGQRRYAIQRILRQETIGSVLSAGGHRRRFIVETEDGSIWELREFTEILGGWQVNKLPSERSL